MKKQTILMKDIKRQSDILMGMNATLFPTTTMIAFGFSPPHICWGRGGAAVFRLRGSRFSPPHICWGRGGAAAFRLPGHVSAGLSLVHSVWYRHVLLLEGSPLISATGELLELSFLVVAQHGEPLIEVGNVLGRGADEEVGQVLLRLVVAFSRV